MGTYSPEPPRKSCTLHAPLNYARGENTPDTSPHDNNATVFDATFVDGPIGRAIHFDGSAERVQITPDVRLHRDRAFTVSAWARPESDRMGTDDTIISKDGEFSLDNGSSANGVSFTLEDASGSTHTVEHDEHLEPGTYTHVVATYDGLRMRLYVNGDPVDSASGGFDIAETNNPVQIGQDAVLSSAEQFIGSVADVRTYRTDIGQDGVDGLLTIGEEHWAIRPMRLAWDNDGIPLRKENLQMAGSLSEGDAHVRQQLDFIKEARHVRDASGQHLDQIGAVAGISRREDESDAVYRARIIGTVTVGRSRGTTENIITAAAAVVGVARNSIEVSTNYEVDPATIDVFIPNTAISDSELSTGDINQILDDSVIGGHDINVLAASPNPFTVRDDSQTNDPSLGVTSDSTSDGGELVEDV